MPLLLKIPDVLNKIELTEFEAPDTTQCVRVSGIDNFLISKIFDCGQCFRFDKIDSDSIVDESNYMSIFEGVAFGRYVRFYQNTADTIEIYNATIEDFEKIWMRYLSLDLDYNLVINDIIERFDTACGSNDQIMRAAIEYGSGIRILRQDPWETVCSFIISQNNNIPRIKKIIAEMSRVFGEPFTHCGRTYYAFPTAKALFNAGEEAIFKLRTGFRAKYIFDAARRAATGELDFKSISAASPEEAMRMLCEIKGVGPKVASCAMLFGFEKTEAFPIDVWIKRVLSKYYPNGLDISLLGRYAGIAQQYLFYYERYQNKLS